ncbi:MAG: hypothetical protein ILA30_05875 [Selenomonas sp.]|nr:hypothetical protein [Selenomonas sp.]
MVTSNRFLQRYCLGFVLLCLCLFLLMTGKAFAHVEQWADPGYAFKGVQKMLVYDFDMSAVKLDSDIAEKNFHSVFWEQVNKQKITVLPLQRVENKVSLLEYKDIDKLRQTNPEAAEAMWKKNLSQVVDVYAKTKYLRYDYTSRVIPAHTEWRTRYVTYTYYDRNGNKHHESVPEQYPVYVPERTVWTLTQQVRLDVYDAKTDKCIYSRNEIRSDDDVGDGKDIFEKIVRNSFKDFLKNVQK